MWLSKDSTQYRLYELARWVPTLDRVIRERVCEHTPKHDWKVRCERTPVLVDFAGIEDYRRKHENCGIYTSVFAYENAQIETCKRLGNLYFDFDHESPEVAHRDTLKLYSYLTKFLSEDSVSVFFTGAKGFHIEVEAVALGLSGSDDIAHDFRYVAQKLADELELATLDFAVYDNRRMWRLVNSQHQKTGLYKVIINADLLASAFSNIAEHAKTPHRVVIKSQQFNIEANQWYKEFMAQRDEERQAAIRKRVEAFEKMGTAVVGKPSDKYARRVWNEALEELKKSPEGGRNNTLNRQAFRLYTLVLSNVLPEELVTNTLREAGLNIGLEEREIGPTLNSAMRAAQKANAQ